MFTCCNEICGCYLTKRASKRAINTGTCIHAWYVSGGGIKHKLHSFQLATPNSIECKYQQYSFINLPQLVVSCVIINQFLLSIIIKLIMAGYSHQVSCPSLYNSEYKILHQITNIYMHQLVLLCNKYLGDVDKYGNSLCGVSVSQDSPPKITLRVKTTELTQHLNTLKL